MNYSVFSKHFIPKFWAFTNNRVTLSTDRTMRIGIYTLFLTPGQIGGIETYLRHLVKHLAHVDRRNRYTLFVTGQNRHLFANLPDNFDLVQISQLPPGPFIVARLMHKLDLLPAYAAHQMQRYPLDVLHYPGSTIDQRTIKIPCVLTLHDLQHEYFPAFFDKQTLQWRQKEYPASIAKARKIITVSNFTRQTIIEKFDLLPDQIQTVYEGVDKIFHTMITHHQCTRLQQKYKLPKEFLYYPANPWPHKNHRRLLQVLNLLNQQYKLRCPLVLSGVWSNVEQLKQQIKQLELDDQVYILGYLPYEELPVLYSCATMLVFPSLFEGFGLPVVEAMACGCPVICANSTSLPEITGEAAMLFDPTNVAQIAEVIYNVWQSRSLRQSLRQKGRAQAKLFSWKQTACKTIEIYQSLL
jgi:glycosyltransferase involved in cell wall biosynthesis